MPAARRRCIDDARGRRSGVGRARKRTMMPMVERILVGVALVGFVVWITVWSIRSDRRESLKQQKAWRDFAASRGFRCEPEANGAPSKRVDRVCGESGGRGFSMDIHTEEANDSTYKGTRVIAAIRDGGRRLTLWRKNAVSSVAARLDITFLRTGDPEFDDRWFVRCGSEKFASRVLNGEVRRGLIRFPKAPEFRVEQGEVRLEWTGMELDEATLDLAIQIVTAAAVE